MPPTRIPGRVGDDFSRRLGSFMLRVFKGRSGRVGSPQWYRCDAIRLRGSSALLSAFGVGRFQGGGGPSTLRLMKVPARRAESPRPSCRAGTGLLRISALSCTIAYFTLGSTGCMVGPDPTPPSSVSPDSWHQELAEGVSRERVAPGAWWKRFDDPMLVELIAVAERKNLNLRDGRQPYQGGEIALRHRRRGPLSPDLGWRRGGIHRRQPAQQPVLRSPTDQLL